jgi:hypothetical protein
MVSAVDRVETSGQSHAHLAIVVTDPQGRRAVVQIVGDADVRAQIERRRSQLSHPVPVRRVVALAVARAAHCGNALRAEQDLDAGAVRTLHELHAFHDVVEPRFGDFVGSGDHEVVGCAVHGHTEVGCEILTAATDLIRDDDSGAARRQRPRMGGLVECGSAEVTVVQDRDVGDTRIGERVSGTLDPDDDDVV